MGTEHGEHDLRGQVALVTGGGRGIGRAVSLGLAQAGAAVGVLARSPDQIAETCQLIERAGGRAIPVTADVTDLDAVERGVAEVRGQLGPVDLLVANAGQLKTVGAVWEVDPDLWWREVEVNLRGPFNCSRAVLPGMLERMSGRIVVVASAAGLGTPPGGGAYTCSKAGAIRFADSLEAGVREHGVRVFAIHPGDLKTALSDRMVSLIQKNIDDARPRVRSEAVTQMGTRILELWKEENLVTFERPVGLVLSLASGRADSLSGRFLSVYDDLDDLIRRAEEIQRDDLYKMRLRK